VKLVESISFEIHKGCSSPGNCRRCICATSQLKQDIDPHAVEKSLTELTTDFNKRISFSGAGEPVDNPALRDLVRLSRSLCPESWITLDTNGVHLTLEFCRRLFEDGLSVIVMYCYNGESLDKAVYLKRMLDDGGWGLFSYSDCTNIPLSSTDNRGGLYSPQRDCFSIPCPLPYKNIYVSVDGDVVSCFVNQMSSVCFGSVFRQSLGEIISSEKYKAFCSKLFLGRNQYPCYRCDYDPRISRPAGRFYPYNFNPNMSP